MKRNSGFTLIELLVVIGILAILAGVVIVAVNPARQFALTRNTQRQAHVTTILNAIGQNMVENNGNFVCAGGPLPAVATPMTDLTTNPAGYDIAGCIVPNYVPTLPFDPSTGSFTSAATYNTGYTVVQAAVGGRVTISAPGTEIPPGTVIVSQTR